MAGRWQLDDERWTAHHREHAAGDKATEAATDVATRALDAYKTQANEFRGSLADQRNEFVTRSEHDMFGKRIDTLEDDKIARDAERRTEIANLADQRDRDRRDAERERWRLGLIVSITAILSSAVVAIILHVAFP